MQSAEQDSPPHSLLGSRDSSRPVYTACIPFGGVVAVWSLPGILPTPQDGAIRQQSRVCATLLGQALGSLEFQNPWMSVPQA
jgi:hypothetical protein